MKRYYFHCDGYEDFHDEVGTVLPTAEAVKHEAIRLASEIMRDHSAETPPEAGWRVFVQDEAGAVVFELTFKLREPSGPS